MSDAEKMQPAATISCGPRNRKSSRYVVQQMLYPMLV